MRRSGLRAAGVFVATFGHVGQLPVAPGTWGSLAGLGLLLLVRLTGDPAFEVAILVLVLAAGIWASSVAERHYGQRDPGVVVVDEVAGMLLALLWLPVGLVGAGVGFLAFRAFDILKPFPARAAERLPGGWGIMADDVVAGLYALAVVRLVAWAAPSVMAP